MLAVFVVVVAVVKILVVLLGGQTVYRSEKSIEKCCPSQAIAWQETWIAHGEPAYKNQPNGERAECVRIICLVEVGYFQWEDVLFVAQKTITR